MRCLAMKNKEQVSEAILDLLQHNWLCKSERELLLEASTMIEALHDLLQIKDEMISFLELKLIKKELEHESDPVGH